MIKVEPRAFEMLYDAYGVTTQVGSIHVRQVGSENNRRHYPLHPATFMLRFLALTNVREKRDTATLASM